MPAAEYDRDTEELSRRYGAASSAIAATLATLAAGAATPAAIRAAQTSVQTTLQALLAASVVWINLHVPRIYLEGAREAIRAVEGPGQDEFRKQVAEVMQSRAHSEAAHALADTLRGDLENLTASMERDAARTLAEIRTRNVQAALGSPLSRVESFAEEMRKRGIQFTDRGGRKWNPERYAETVLRTHTANILNAGHLNKTLEMGSMYVRVFDGGPGTVDEPCKRANGQVWHVAYAARHLIEHPNCRRSFAGLPKGYAGRVDREAV